MRIERRLTKLEASLPKPQELPSVPADLAAELARPEVQAEFAALAPWNPAHLTTKQREALTALSTGLLKQRFTE